MTNNRYEDEEEEIKEPTLVTIWVTPETRQAIKQEALTNNRSMIEELSAMYLSK